MNIDIQDCCGQNTADSNAIIGETAARVFCISADKMSA